MHLVSTLFPEHRELVSLVETPVKTANPGRCLDWRQWLRPWCVRCLHPERWREVSQRLDDLGETQHPLGQARATEGHQYCMSWTNPALHIGIHIMLS